MLAGAQSGKATEDVAPVEAVRGGKRKPLLSYAERQARTAANRFAALAPAGPGETDAAAAQRRADIAQMRKLLQQAR